MKFLLTSAGIKNTSIHDALVDLLGKPIAESSAGTRWYVVHLFDSDDTYVAIIEKTGG
jgi:hypothetical protein